jgi:hypothetical protein
MKLRSRSHVFTAPAVCRMCVCVSVSVSVSVCLSVCDACTHTDISIIHADTHYDGCMKLCICIPREEGEGGDGEDRGGGFMEGGLVHRYRAHECHAMQGERLHVVEDGC